MKEASERVIDENGYVRKGVYEGLVHVQSRMRYLKLALSFSALDQETLQDIRREIVRLGRFLDIGEEYALL